MSWRTVWQRWLEWLNPWLGLRAIMPMDFPGAPVPPVAPSRVYAASAPEVVPFVAGPNVCEVCGLTLAANTARTFDGHWRCAQHKGVTCDDCGRALPASSLRDQPWRCAAHR